MFSRNYETRPSAEFGAKAVLFIVSNAQCYERRRDFRKGERG